MREMSTKELVAKLRSAGDVTSQLAADRIELAEQVIAIYAGDIRTAYSDVYQYGLDPLPAL